MMTSRMSTIAVIFLLSILPAACGAGEPPPPEGVGGTETLVVTSDTTLLEDHQGSVEIQADNVSLDCAGHAISGPGTRTEGLWGFIGISVNGWTGVTIRNCQVSGFDHGILLISLNGVSERNRVLGNTVSANRVDG